MKKRTKRKKISKKISLKKRSRSPSNKSKSSKVKKLIRLASSRKKKGKKR